VSGSGNTTVPFSEDDPAPRRRDTRLVPTLFLVDSADEPERVGEGAPLDDGIASIWLMGRGPETVEELVAWLHFRHRRPGVSIDRGLLTGEVLSRKQLRFRILRDGLEVTNIGQLLLLIDGQPVKPETSHVIRPGAVLTLRGNCILLFLMRPMTLPVPVAPLGPAHAYGEPDLDSIVGESPAAWALRGAIAAALLVRGHIFVHGPTGTGKELVARAIHRRSGRRGEFVAYNAANLTTSLAESILFGNPANYPNPGMAERPGLLGRAQEGTLFLDEIGQLPLDAQARLLRALEGEIVRVGDSMQREVDVLLVGATNGELSSLKHDLLPRFAYVVETPALATRLEDVTLVARALILREYQRNQALASRFVRPGRSGRLEVMLAPALVLALLKCPYTKNVRDLRNLLVRAMTETVEAPLMPPEDMTPWQRPPTLPPPAPGGGGEDVGALLDGLGPSADDILAALIEHGWHQGRAAKALGIKRDQLRRRMKKFGIERP
jgi:two-component system nitrogen regulation response regulator GlnG/two-component system response regulator HydG